MQRLAEQDEWAADEWPSWEGLSYMAADAYAEATGEEDGLHDAMEQRGHTDQCDPDPSGLPWSLRDPEAVVRRLPRLSRMF